MKVFCTAIIVAVLAFIENGDTLQCWKCRTDIYGACGENFNSSRYPRFSSYQQYQGSNPDVPHIITCDSPNYQTGGYGGGNSYGYQRQVCLKRVETNKRTRQITYERGCHTLVGDESVGTCPSHTTYNTYNDADIDFCEYCDTHECNGAEALQKVSFWIGLIPIAVALALRK